MKTIVLIIITLYITALSNAQIVNIPDANFKNALLSANTSNFIAMGINMQPIIIDANGDNEIQTNEALLVYYLDVSNKSISDLTGIEAFTNLRSLHCHENQLSSMDISNNTNLLNLGCNFNQLTYLDVSNLTNLTELQCKYNQLTNLDISNNTNLGHLVCEVNSINNLDLTTNTNLIDLYCSHNQLTNIDVSNNTNLEVLSCYRNQINNLDLSNNISLILLDCNNNQINNLDISNNANLNQIFCDHNSLTNLDVSSCTGLTQLVCNDNPNLGYINTKNSNNNNMIVTNNGSSCQFDNLPNLQAVCVDALNTNLTNYITSEVGHNVNFYTDCSLASVDDNNLATFTIFPNPTNNIINIEADFAIDSIILFNGAGQILSIKSNSDTLDISKLSEGVYFIKIQTKDNKFYTKKIIKN